MEVVVRHIYSLPWPPSTNESHVNFVATVKRGPKAGKKYVRQGLSTETREFRRLVEVAVREGHRAPPRLTGRLWGTILVCPPDKRAHDLDNRVKQTLDALQRAGVFENDSQFDAIPVFRGTTIHGWRVLVSVEPYSPTRAEQMLVSAGLPRPWDTVSIVDAEQLPF